MYEFGSDDGLRWTPSPGSVAVTHRSLLRLGQKCVGLPGSFLFEYLAGHEQPISDQTKVSAFPLAWLSFKHFNM